MHAEKLDARWLAQRRPMIAAMPVSLRSRLTCSVLKAAIADRKTLQYHRIMVYQIHLTIRFALLAASS
jgi:hypothetical protein